VSAGLEDVRTASRVTGSGPVKVLLLHALTGGPEPADRPGVKGWWNPLFQPGAPLDPAAVTVWTPNLLGSCYGTTGPGPVTPRTQAAALAAWIAREGLSFDALIGGSLGGMVALELAVLATGRFRTVGVIGCGGRADAWLWGSNEVQLAILDNPSLGDAEAIALARRAAMLSFRSPASLNGRFQDAPAVKAWLAHHGAALADRFTRDSYRVLLTAMDAHDIGRGRGGLVQALTNMEGHLHVLGLESDQLFSRSCLEELADAARQAGRLGSQAWLASPHGHDAFLIEWDQVKAWTDRILREEA
jgi:homoserine O-acetyltransferase